MMSKELLLLAVLGLMSVAYAEDLKYSVDTSSRVTVTAKNTACKPGYMAQTIVRGTGRFDSVIVESQCTPIFCAVVHMGVFSKYNVYVETDTFGTPRILPSNVTVWEDGNTPLRGGLKLYSKDLDKSSAIAAAKKLIQNGVCAKYRYAAARWLPDL